MREVDGIAWTLPALTRDGAEQARIRLTDLATALGYSDKAQLKLLAIRHEPELAEFGETFTVKVSVRQGFTSKVIDEPTYNPDQAAYLALSSETEQGRACRVRILKAYKSLLAMFEQVVQSRSAADDRVLDTMNEQARTIRIVLERDLLREKNELERLKAQAGWADRKPKVRQSEQNPNQVDFLVEQEAAEIHARAQKVIGMRQKRAANDLERETAASSVYRELRADLARRGHVVPSVSDEAQNHYIARKGLTSLAFDALSAIYDKEKQSKRTAP